MTSGRKALLADYIDEWATPVLFLRSPDGRVFDAISSPSVPTNQSGSAESDGDALTALTVATHGEESPKRDGTEDVVPSAPVPPLAEPKRTGFGKRFMVVGVIVAALIVASVGVVRWRSSAEDAQTPQGQTIPAAPSTGSSATSTGAPAVPASRTINVPGAQAWTDTFLSCEPGLILDIAATGTVLFDKAYPKLAVGPDGSTDLSYREHNVAGLPDANHAALIGRLDQAKPFVVASFHTYSCADRGRLFLGVNDKGVDSNSGAFIATITPHR